MARNGAVESLVSVGILGVVGYFAWKIWQNYQAANPAAAATPVKTVVAGSPTNTPLFLKTGEGVIFVKPPAPLGPDFKTDPNAQIEIRVVPLSDPAFGVGQGNGADSTGP